MVCNIGFLASCAKTGSIHANRAIIPPPTFITEGTASWYGKQFHGRKTASGERFNTYALTCAHRTLPFGTRLKVINVNNGRETIVIVNDRGPFIRSRVLDVSLAAAEELQFIGQGTALVRIERMND